MGARGENDRQKKFTAPRWGPLINGFWERVYPSISLAEQGELRRKRTRDGERGDFVREEVDWFISIAVKILA